MAHEKAAEAANYERQGDQKRAIETWGDILGLEFPEYTGN